MAAQPLTDAQLEAHVVRRPGQIGAGPFLVTVDALRWGGAQRTQRHGLGRSHREGDLRRGVVDVTCVEVSRHRIG